MAYTKGEKFSSLKMTFNDKSTGKNVIKTKTLTNLKPDLDASTLGELSKKIENVVNFEFVKVYEVSITEINAQM